MEEGIGTEYRVEVEVKWDYAHRLLSKDGSFYDKNKCGSLHGHSAKAIITFRNDSLDKYGFAIDFSIVKKSIKEWINKNWDHATIVHWKDLNLINFLEQENDRHYIMPRTLTTSAESLACHLYNIINKMDLAIPLYSVSVYETEDNKATYMELY